MQFTKGQEVLVPCKVQSGPFSGELMVSIDAGDSKISGFVPRHAVEGTFLVGTVVEVGTDRIRVWLPGSFFTTANGIASLPQAWARNHLQVER